MIRSWPQKKNRIPPKQNRSPPKKPSPTVVAKAHPKKQTIIVPAYPVIPDAPRMSSEKRGQYHTPQQPPEVKAGQPPVIVQITQRLPEKKNAVLCQLIKCSVDVT
jgi:hypothetical protein